LGAEIEAALRVRCDYLSGFAASEVHGRGEISILPFA